MESKGSLETSPILSLKKTSGKSHSPTPDPMELTTMGAEQREGCNGLGNPDEDGLNVWQAAIIIVGLCMDFSLLSVEALVVSTGWIGFLLATVSCCALVYTAVLLGRCWGMVGDKWQTERHPFAAIAYEACGDWARSAMNVIVGICCFTVTIGVITMTSENLFILGGPALHGKFCLFPPVIAAVAYPFMWYGTPKDIWQLSGLGALTGSFAYVLLLIATVATSNKPDMADDSNASSVSDVAPSSVVRGNFLVHLAEICGITQVAIAAHFVLPSVYQDMKHPEKYSKTVLASYGFIFSLALPLLAATWAFQRDLLADATADSTVLAVLEVGPLSVVPGVLFLVRNTAVMVTCNNPLFQSLEEQLDVPSEFNWKRVILRTSVLLIQVFISETIPHFGVIFTLVGGCCLPVVSFLAPAFCYLRLRNIHRPEKYRESKSVWVLETVVCWLIIAITPILIVTVLYVLGSGIFQGKTVFTVPCYINATLSHE